MVSTSRTELDLHALGGRLISRPSVARARSWTGRSAVARATDSRLSRLATAGTRVTRVSAMRTLPVRADRLAPNGAAVTTGRATVSRRREPGPPLTSG
jgi:hypothetical protein